MPEMVNMMDDMVDICFLLRCDVCGQLIEHPSLGAVEFDNSTKETVRIVHDDDGCWPDVPDAQHGGCGAPDNRTRESIGRLVGREGASTALQLGEAHHCPSEMEVIFRRVQAACIRVDDDCLCYELLKWDCHCYPDGDPEYTSPEGESYTEAPAFAKNLSLAARLLAPLATRYVVKIRNGRLGPPFIAWEVEVSKGHDAVAIGISKTVSGAITNAAAGVLFAESHGLAPKPEWPDHA